MSRPSFELADIINTYLPLMNQNKILTHHKRTLSAIARCRTSALGSHSEKCDDCGHIKVSYNSCRNRHCPKCQGVEKESWIIMQEDMLLPVVYFHVVFTLPHELNPLCLYNPKEMYDLLFQSAWKTLDTLARDKKWIGGQTAATMILHTWSQKLMLHPHVHCIVPNGAITKNGKWQFPKRGHHNFLFPVLAMNKIFRAVYLKGLKELIKSRSLTIPKVITQEYNSVEALIKILYKKQWVVYTKKPFAGTKHVIDYLGRYSHRVAITNQRILSIDNNEIKIIYKDYKDHAQKKETIISGTDFIKRFCLHILPSHYRKVRQYGFTANASKQKSIHIARESLQCQLIIMLTRKERKALAVLRLFGAELDLCPCCKKGKMSILYTPHGNKDPPNKNNTESNIKE